MVPTAIALQRLYQQRLTHHPFATPAEVVAWLGAVQAQDYPGAKWALALRMPQATDDQIDQAFNNGAILRTHVMRPTWHFVTPDDIRWLLKLTAPRVEAKLRTTDQRLELDKAVLLRSYTIMANALRGGKQLTRTALGAALAQEGIAVENLRLTHIVMHAELEAIICSGPRHGKQFTYMLLDERAPHSRRLDRDEALAALVRRYFTGHGPATIQDFVWWSGLTVADAKAGLATVGVDLTCEVIEGKTYWFSPAIPPLVERSSAAFLLPTFDEFLVGFAAFDQSRRGGRPPSRNGVFDPPLVIGGQVVGSWRRTIGKREVIVELAPFEPLSPADGTAIRVAAQRYGEFLGMPVTLHTNPAQSTL